MDKNRDNPGLKRKRKTDEVSSTSENYTSTESDEYYNSEDSSDDVASDHRYKTILIENFFPDYYTNRALKIEISISQRAWRDGITAKCTHEGKAIGHAIASFNHSGKYHKGLLGKDG